MQLFEIITVGNQLAIQLVFFPNSGHHYVFLPLSEALRPQDFKPDTPPAQIDQFKQQLAAADDTVGNLCDKSREDAWQALRPETQCARYRFGTQKLENDNRRHGIWLAVETNCGNNLRGAIYEPSATPSQNETAPRNPYAATTTADLLEIDHSFTKPVPPGAAAAAVGHPLQRVRLKWDNVDRGTPVDVDIIIDLGNTRTAVILLERGNSIRKTAPLNQLVSPVDFPREPVSISPKDFDRVIPSWILLHETRFSETEPGSPDSERLKAHNRLNLLREELYDNVRDWLGRTKTIVKTEIRRLPQMFVELAPVQTGELAGETLRNYKFEKGGMVFLSSPKRYIWDDEPVGQPHWHMVRKLSKANEDTVGVHLRASVLRYIPETNAVADDEEEEWPLTEPPLARPLNIPDKARPSPAPPKPTYPLSEALVWMALSILEAAYRQMCSPRHINRFLPGVRRRLHGVHVTYPSGWSDREIRLYRRKWQTALRIFYLNHLDDRKGSNHSEVPELYMDTDEALASQLPFVYEEIGRLGKAWIELIGRGEGRKATVRVMSVDIGGGTTDYSIVEYADKIDNLGQISLHATLLFKDSSSSAGDLLIKNLIEQVVLPGLGEDFYGNREQLNVFKGVADPQAFDFSDAERLKRATRLALVPLATQFLAERVANPDAETLKVDLASNALDTAAATLAKDFDYLLAKLARDQGGTVATAPPQIPAGKVLHCPAELFRRCVHHTFTSVFDSITQFLVAFAVDLVVVNGKPTEIPDVTRLLQERLPISADRMLTAKEFPVRGWYPFRAQDKIADAKTVTVTGAALFRALKAQLVADWRVEFSASRQLRCRNYWVYIGEIGNRAKQIYLTPADDEREVTLLVNSRIGRQLVLGAANPEPVYRLRWRKTCTDSADLGNAEVTLVLRRVSPAEEAEEELGSTKSEYLEIVSARGTVNIRGGKRVITKEDVELKLCLIEQDHFWMDDPKFHVQWEGLMAHRRPGVQLGGPAAR